MRLVKLLLKAFVVDKMYDYLYFYNIIYI